MDIYVVFHSPELFQISPGVTATWKQEPLELLVNSGAAGGFGNDPCIACASFIAWCAAQKPEVAQQLSAINIPSTHSFEESNHQDIYMATLNMLSSWDPQPFFVDLDVFKVTRGEDILWGG